MLTHLPTSMMASDRQQPDSSDSRDEPDDLVQDRISIQVDEPYRDEVGAAGLARAVTAALRAEGRGDAEMTVVVTSDEESAALNARFRGVEGPTDVLAFSAQEPAPGFISAPEAASYLGDVIIALPYTRRQAEELGRGLSDELRLLAVHGTLHLLGYDHSEPGEQAEMWARQDTILEKLDESFPA